MRFLLDENLPKRLVDSFRKNGFQCEHAMEVGLGGANDQDIARYAKNNRCILVTKDLEFASLIVYPKGAHHGLLVIRLPYTSTSDQIIAAISDFLKDNQVEELVGAITILEVGRIRVRKTE